MRFGRTSKAVGTAAIAALALSACASSESGGNGDSTEGGSTQASGGTITVAEVNPFTSFNSNSATGNVDINGTIEYLTQWDFNYPNNDLELQRNEEFGTYKKLSDDPLKVKYTINEGVVWSDGEPVDAGDLLLAWAVQSGHFNDAKTDDAGEVVSGTNYFAYAGSTEGLGLTDVPEVSDDGRTITLEYSKPFADWEVSYGMGLPAHVVAEKAGLADEQALVDLILSAPEGDPDNPQKRPELKKVADVWNTGFDTTTLPSDPGVYLSTGPFVVQDMVPDRSMTLVPNPEYDWGPKPKYDEIVIRYIGESPAQVQALQNGEVDIIAPQASGDIKASLEQLSGIEMLTGQQLAYDHIDLQYGGVFKDESVRKAFMHTVPREQIVQSTISQVIPDAKPRDSHVFDIGTPGYKASVPVNGSENYQEPDIAKAKELLDGRTPEVKIMYSKDNPNRVDAYTLIAESAEKAGFNVVDGGLPGNEWGAALTAGGWDATIFGWISDGVTVTSVLQLYGCGSASNFTGFCDDEAQKAMEELLVTTDPEKQQELQMVVDKRLFATGYGLPLFQTPGVFAHNDRIEGVEYMGNQTGVWWNFWEWEIAN